METSKVSPPKPPSGVFSLPSTRLGWWSGGLFVQSLILILLNNLIVMPYTEQAGGLDQVQRIFNLIVFLWIAAAGLTGLVALIWKRERSVVVFLCLFLLLFALAMNLMPMLLD